MTAKFPRLFPTLKVKDYMLTMENETSDQFKVWKSGSLVGRISVTFDTIRAYGGIGISYIPYDVSIFVHESTEILPIDFFKKIFMATVQVS